MVAAVTASLLESPLDSLPAIEGRFVYGGMLGLRRGGRDPVPHLTFDHIQHPAGGRPGALAPRRSGGRGDGARARHGRKAGAPAFGGAGMIGLASELSQM